MKTDQQTRLECVRLANSLACAKVLPPKEVIKVAAEIYDWINQPLGSARER